MAIFRDVFRDPLRDVLRDPFGESSADPLLSLFSGGQLGAYFAAWRTESLPDDGDGALVPTLNDIDGNTANNATQGTTALQPQIQTDGSGFRYVSWDGVDDILQTAAGMFASPLNEIWFAACVDTNNAAPRNLICGISNGGYGSGADRFFALDLSPSTGGTAPPRIQAYSGSTFNLSGSTAVIGTPSVIHGYWDGTNLRLRVNGSDEGATPFAPASMAVDQELDIGAVNNSASIVVESPIRLYGLIVRDTAPTPAEIALVDTEFKANSPASF